MSTKIVVACQCDRCGHVWLPRKLDPSRCAHCKSPAWDKPKKTKDS